MTNFLTRWADPGRRSSAGIDLTRLLVEPASVYHSRRGEFLTSHLLAEFRANPPLFRKREQGLVREERRDSYVLGEAAHALVLEGRDVYEARFAFGGPVNPRTGRPYGSGTQKFEEWAAQQGKPVLSDDQAALVERLDLAVRCHPLATDFLAKGVPERVARCELDGVPCQARFDWIHPSKGLVDFKTCDDLTTFGWSARSYGYLHQMSFYRSVLRAATGTTVDVHLIGVEKREPFRCGVWRVSESVLDQAEKENAEAIGRLVACRRDDFWPSGFEGLLTIDYL